MSGSVDLKTDGGELWPDLSGGAMGLGAATATAGSDGLSLITPGAMAAGGVPASSALELVPVRQPMGLVPAADHQLVGQLRFRMPSTLAAPANSATTPAQDVLATVPEPLDTGCCSVTVIRTIEGVSLVILVVAVATLFYLIFGPGAEALTYVGDGLAIGLSGSNTYLAHQVAGGMSVQAQVARLSAQVSRLSAEINRLKPENDRYAALNRRFEGLLEKLTDAANGFQGINAALRLTNGDMRLTADSLESVAGAFEALLGKMKTYADGFDAQIAALRRENVALTRTRESVEAVLSQIKTELGASGDVVQAAGIVQGKLVSAHQTLLAKQTEVTAQLAEITRQQANLTAREHALVEQAERLAKTRDAAQAELLAITHQQNHNTQREIAMLDRVESVFAGTAAARADAAATPLLLQPTPAPTSASAVTPSFGLDLSGLGGGLGGAPALTDLTPASVAITIAPANGSAAATATPATLSG